MATSWSRSSVRRESLLLEQLRKLRIVIGNEEKGEEEFCLLSAASEVHSYLDDRTRNNDDDDGSNAFRDMRYSSDGQTTMTARRDGLAATTTESCSTPNNMMMDFGRTRRSIASLVDPGGSLALHFLSDREPAIELESPLGNDDVALSIGNGNDEVKQSAASTSTKTSSTTTIEQKQTATRDGLTICSKLSSCILCCCHKTGFQEIIHQLPSIVATWLLLLMVAIPFGVAYFPIYWRSTEEQGTLDQQDDGNQNMEFPLPGKESLGIRMALFATFTGQLVLTFASGFRNPVAFQLLENVPFYHALAKIVLQEQGCGKDALSTLFFLFGLSSIAVGLVFYALGKLELGRVAYFFPSHVLVGCIGGIGLFIIVTSMEVTNNQDFTWNREGFVGLLEKWHLFGLVLLFEGILRVLSAILVDREGKPKFRFLTPIFFISIVPLFYVGLFLLGVTYQQARELGYLFPDPSCPSGECKPVSFHEKVYNGHVFDIFKIVDLRVINWTAVRKSVGTILALCAFSLIHVPINIPAFAVSSNVDVDMNTELMAHGYSNVLSGLFGGLQNVMTYSFSVMYQKSGGGGIPSCLTITAGIVLLFVYGPAIAVYFPRCMAGTLLLHIGLDLFLEGCYDSYGKFDALEYAGIWFITITMSAFGMTAALLAGILSAVSTYAVQSITHLHPVFRVMHATNLRSSIWERPSEAMNILDTTLTGRSRILIVQLQGHLFFGNIAVLTDTVKGLLSRKIRTEEHPLIVVMDFSLVVGMDSSAAHGIAKLKNLMHRLYEVEVSIFVTGTHRDGFPCAYALSEALSVAEPHSPTSNEEDHITISSTSLPYSQEHSCQVVPRGSVGVSATSASFRAFQAVARGWPKNRVCNSLDEALSFAEDILVARVNPAAHLRRPAGILGDINDFDNTAQWTEEEERLLAVAFVEKLVPMSITPEIEQSIKRLVSQCVREEYRDGDVIWMEGDESNSAKILVSGRVCATLEGSRLPETVPQGNVFGELGLIDGTRRLNTVTCKSRVVVYSLDRESFDRMVQFNQLEARLMERIAIRYLAHRVQHVSNRIFDTHCLPI